VVTSFILGYFFSSFFMYTIHEFWFVAVAAADRMAIWPLLPISLASKSTSDSPMVDVTAWLTNRWFGHVTSESAETTTRPAARAWASDGHRADGSFPAITIPAA